MIKEKYKQLLLYAQIRGITTIGDILTVRAYARKNEFAENIRRILLIYAENNSYICRIK
jgi:phospholipase C